MTICLHHMLREAKIQFMKYSAPLFFLSGVNITVVEVMKYVITIDFISKPVLLTEPERRPHQDTYELY